MDLDLSSAFAVAKKICTVEVLGVVEASDLAAALRSAPATMPDAARIAADDEGDVASLKKLREKHHSVARLIAGGMTQRTAAAIAGYTESYLSVLLDNPAMIELVAFYRTGYQAANEAITERLKKAAGTALELLQEQMDAGGKDTDPQVLLGVAKLGYDRAGHGPSSHQHLVTEQHIFDHAELKRRDQAAREASASRIIEQPPQLPAPSEAADESAE
jgi:hypothetical protein